MFHPLTDEIDGIGWVGGAKNAEKGNDMFVTQ
jgi:hypothetical protein